MNKSPTPTPAESSEEFHVDGLKSLERRFGRWHLALQHIANWPCINKEFVPIQERYIRPLRIEELIIVLESYEKVARKALDENLQTDDNDPCTEAAIFTPIYK